MTGAAVQIGIAFLVTPTMDELEGTSFEVLYWIAISLPVAIVEDVSRVVVESKSHPNSSRQMSASVNVL